MRSLARVGTPTALLSNRRLLLQSRVQRTLSPSAATTTTTVASRRSVHAEARDGFGGNNASFYERSRPGYPSDALRAIEAELRRHDLHGGSGGGGGGGGSGCSGGTSGCGGSLLVDLGCGTGKFTREILPFTRSEDLSLVGIEPVEAMRKQFEKALPGVRILDGIAEDIPLPGSSARALIAAQSFHWMASSATLREVHRVLVPGGLFVMLWNTRDLSRPWVRAVEDIIDPFYGDDVPRQHGGLWMQSFQDLENQSSGEENHEEGAGQRHRHRSFFGELTEHHFRHSQLLTLDELDDRMRSISVIATRPESERAGASHRARQLAETHWDARDELQKSGRVELAYDTEVYWCRKLDALPPQ